MDKTLVKEFNAILEWSQNYPFPVQTDSLLDDWETAKAPFLKLFGDTYLRSPQPITIKLTTDEKAKRFEDFVNTLDDNDLLSPELKEFLEKNEEGFFENKVVSSENPHNIAKGAKLSKAFKKFIPNPSSLDWARTLASRYIQEDKITGYLYLSVDPRDFLTLSENGENWRSCHALDGAYRAGNLNYMVDEVTMVAYLADKEPKWYQPLPRNQKWFSKRWRTLIHIKNLNQGTISSVYFNKQYPYESSALLEHVYHMIEDNIFNQEDKRSHREPRVCGFRYYYVGNHPEIMQRNQLVDSAADYVHDSSEIIDFSDYKGYPDLVLSPTYVPVISTNREQEYAYRDYCYSYRFAMDRAKETELFKEIYGIKIGKKAKCVCCGRRGIKRERSFLCEACLDDYGTDEFYEVCVECGHRIDTIIYYDYDGESLCESCYNKYCIKEES